MRPCPNASLLFAVSDSMIVFHSFYCIGLLCSSTQELKLLCVAWAVVLQSLVVIFADDWVTCYYFNKMVVAAFNCEICGKAFEF